MTATEKPQTKADFVRSQALRATRSQLAEHGLAVTMDQIAEASGISRRTLFRHFESRDALVQAALEDAVDHYEHQLAPANPVGPDLRAWLTAVVEQTHRNHLAAGLAIWQITSTADADLPAELRAVNKRRRAMRRRVTGSITEQAWAAAGGVGQPPAPVAEAMAMAMSGYATRSLVLDLEQSVEATSRLAADIIITVIEAKLVS